MVGFILPSSHPPPPPRRLSSLPTTELTPTWCPSPLLRDVGPSPSRSMKETAKGNEEPQGGPMKWEAQQVRHKDEPRLLSWFGFALSHSSPPLTRRIDETAGQSTRRRANPRDTGPIHETPGQSTRHQANPQDVGPINNTTSQFTTRRANPQHTGPLGLIDEMGGQSRANRRHCEPIDKTGGQSTRHRAIHDKIGRASCRERV